jgi:hypothetical protein
MNITRKTTRTKGANLAVCDPYTGVMYNTAFGLDTEKGYLDMWVINPATKKVFVDMRKHEIVKIRIYVNYDVVSRITGEVLHEVRWPWVDRSVRE